MGARVFRLLLAGLGGSFLLLMGIAFSPKIVEDTRFLVQGEVMEGTVTGTTSELSRTGKGSQRSYHIQYNYAVGGREYGGQSPVGRLAYLSKSRGDRLSVCYLPSRPRRSRYGGRREILMDLAIFGGFVLVVVGGGLLTVYRGLSRGAPAPSTGANASKGKPLFGSTRRQV